MSERRLLILILAAYLALGTTYALTTPVFEASDELWHYPMIRHLADGNALPVQVFDPAEAGPWNQEASQPPLYYYLGAALTLWIDTTDIAQARRLNPHVDNGVVTADGNINLVVHDPALSPWRGTLLAVRIVRLVSVLMGTATIYLTYLLAREIAPHRPEISLGAATINAFTPMFLFISGAVNNDNLAVMLASLALLTMVLIVKEGLGTTKQPGPGRWMLLGAVIGLALLTKEGTLGLIPMALGTAAIAAWQNLPELQSKDGQTTRRKALPALVSLAVHAARLFLLTLLPVILIAGWWYYRNVVLYGDWLGWNAFIAVLGQRPQPATLAQLWDERWGFLASYWGLFGGVNVPMPDWVYAIFNGLLLIAVPGFLVFALKTLLAWKKTTGEINNPTESNRLPKWLHGLFSFVARNFPLVAAVLFSTAVIAGLINWATTTWSSQGRLAFTAISALSALLALGLFGWLPRRFAPFAASAVAAFFLGVSVLAPFLWIRPAYQPEPATPPTALQPIHVNFGDQVALQGYTILTKSAERAVQPGEYVDVYLEWEILDRTARDWSVFVHLNDPLLQTPVAQRDMYPGAGLLATSFLEPGQQLVEFYRLQIPITAVAPATLELAVGLYDYQTGERLHTTQGGADAVILRSLALARPLEGQPRGLDVNLGQEIALVYFDMEPRRLAPGDNLNLTLHWEALRAPREDYTLFAQVLNDRDTTRWAALDLPTETSRWVPGQVQTVRMPLTIDPETPAGVYTVIVGAYTRGDDGSFNRLQIVREGRITMDDVIQLARIRIE